MAIQSFGINTGHDAATALHSLHAQGASSYVIDLRGNSGGLVSAGLSWPFPQYFQLGMHLGTLCLKLSIFLEHLLYSC